MRRETIYKLYNMYCICDPTCMYCLVNKALYSNNKFLVKCSKTTITIGLKIPHLNITSHYKPFLEKVLKILARQNLDNILKVIIKKWFQ
jgi:hypothetical protein